MKKVFIIIVSIVVTLCISLVSTQAQSKYDRGVSIGIKGAANISYITSYYNSPWIGWNAGFNVRVPFADRFSFYGEVNYDRYSVFQAIIMGCNSEAVFLRNNYVSLPLLVQYQFGARGRSYLSFGPTVRFSTGAVNSYYDNSTFTLTTSPHSIGWDNIYPMVLAVNVGYGMTIPVAERFDFVWECRFSGDVTPIYKKGSDSYHYRYPHIINLGFMIGLMYKL